MVTKTHPAEQMSASLVGVRALDNSIFSGLHRSMLLVFIFYLATSLQCLRAA
jgi:hypothetical protein